VRNVWGARWLAYEEDWRTLIAPNAPRTEAFQHNPVPAHHFTYNSFSQFRDAYTLDQRVATP